MTARRGEGSTERLWSLKTRGYRSPMAPRIEPSLPEPIETMIARELRAKGISRTHYFETAAAFLAGYEKREREDAEELNRLSEWARHADRRLETVERRLRIKRPT